jgi:hypothetical protein
MAIVWKQAQALAAGGVWQWPNVWNYNTVPAWESYAAGNVNTVIDVTALEPHEWGDYMMVRHGKLFIRQQENSVVWRGVLAANWGMLPLNCLPMKLINVDPLSWRTVRCGPGIDYPEMHRLNLGEEVLVWRFTVTNDNLWALIRPDPTGHAPWWVCMMLNTSKPYLTSVES